MVEYKDGILEAYEEVLNEQVVNENMKILKDAFKKIKNMTAGAAVKFFKKEWEKLVAAVEKNNDRNELEREMLRIINKGTGQNYNSLKQISKGRVVEGKEELNEDFAHFWDMIKTEMFPMLSFYPGLTIWMELDKLASLQGGVDWNKVTVYSIFWLILVSGKFFKEWKKWKNENPEEWKAEGGKKNPLAL